MEKTIPIYMQLKEGVYENIISRQVESDIRDTEAAGLVCQRADMDSAESAKMLADFLARSIMKKLDDGNSSVEEKIEMVNDVLEKTQTADEDVIRTPQLLSAVISRQRQVTLETTRTEPERPKSGFRVSNLFTGGQSEISLGSEIMRDIASADNISFIVSFLRMSGVRMILDELKKFCSQPGHTLRIITTTYCGHTEAKAIEQLAALPNTDIRISYNTKIERLHAKCYIFERNSGFSTAYIGSSNLSHSAQTDGLEWNIRVTNVENPHIIKSALATFERYWDSENFEDFRIGGIEKFNRELGRQGPTPQVGTLLQHYQLLPHQKVILDRLQVERDECGLFRNLVVAATGTGKTVISAFDYKRFRDANPRARLLFVAHRKEILEQAAQTYRSVLQDANFGELWVGDYAPLTSLEYLFVSVANFHNNTDRFKQLGAGYYDYIVIDEAHHAAASSYRDIVTFFEPRILIGLTATPERMDGQSLLPDFGGKISAEIRLAQALDEGLLTPFQYICISDPTDISDDDLWRNGRYITDKLTDKLCNAERVGLIVQKLREYIADECKCRALCFCSDKRHARYMADMLQRQGLKAASLTSDSTDEDRKQLNSDLAAGRINYLCVVDMFNEGVDIPEVDTALFLRPTDSLTVYLQQLGRGLRLSPGKSYLTVLDFVAQVNRHYDFASRLRGISKKPWNYQSEIVPLLPAGCSIYMEQKAKEYIIQSIKNALYNKKKLVEELRSYPGTPTLSEFVEANGQDVRLIYRGGRCWTSLKRDAGKCAYTDDEVTKQLAAGMANLVHINSVRFIRFIRTYLRNNCRVTTAAGSLERHFALMLYYALFKECIGKTRYHDTDEALAAVDRYPLFKQEMSELMDCLVARLEFKTRPMGDTALPGSLELYGCYTKEEIFILFNRQTADKKMQGCAAGVFNVEELNTELFFITLNKSDKDFSPTTQYDDYFISESRFHWQSQNTMSHSNNGSRYVNQRTNGRKFLLFVREAKNDGFGNTMPYYCMGLVDYIRSTGNFPMNIEWKMQSPALPKFLKSV